MKCSKLFSWIILLLGSAIFATAQNLPADLDLSFGINGLNAAVPGYAADLIELNGEYITVGRADIVKYSSQGAVINQTLTILPNSILFHPTAVAVQTDPSSGQQFLIVAGFQYISSSPPVYEAVVARYDTNLALDQSFSGGAVQFNVNGNSINFINDIAVQSDGKILLVGGAGPNVTNERQFIVRLEPEGRFDLSFGVDGVVETPIGSQSSAHSVVYSPRLGIFVGGSSVSAPGGFSDSTVTRYDFDGNLNPAFNSTGIVVLPGGGPAAILLNTDSITVAGVQNSVSNGFGLAKLDLQGNLNARFGNGGYSIRQSADFFTLTSIALQTSRKIVVAGRSTNLMTGKQSLLIARYNSDGSPDAEFTSSYSQSLTGTRVINVNRATSDAGSAVLVNSAKRLVVAGYSINGSSQTFLLAQFLGN